MKKLLFLALVSISTLAADSDKLGVLYDPSANNTVSPTTLRVGNFSVLTNFTLAGKTPARVVVLDSSTNTTASDLTQTQANQLALMVGGTNVLLLGDARIISGEGNPTNGTSHNFKALYINTTASDLNSTFWGNSGTNWFTLASTNAGAITETQLNFSDNTIANVSTNMHGLVPKAPMNARLYLDGYGAWSNPIDFGLLTDGYVPFAIDDGSGVIILNNSRFLLGSPVAGDGMIHTSTNKFRSNHIFVTNNIYGREIYGNDIIVTNVAAGSLLRSDSNRKISAVTIGAGLSFDGTTLSQSGSGTNALGTTGTPAATQLSYFTGSNTISGVPGSSVSIAGVDIPTLTASTAFSINTAATSGNVLAGKYTPTVTGYSGFSTTIGTTQVPCNYVRIGNTIMVSGKVQITKETSRYLRFYVSLPITGISSVNYLNGTWSIQEGSSGLEGGTAGYIIGHTAGDICTFYMDTGSTSGGLRTAHFNFTYNLSY
jgi:hypothetical protein